jgi:putative oxidoreductase
MEYHGLQQEERRGFAGYFRRLGFPPFTACTITIFEMLASISILAEKWVAPLCILFILELIVGIIFVSLQEEWFVVGGGRNGMEYSVLLIFWFSAIAISH